MIDHVSAKSLIPIYYSPIALTSRVLEGLWVGGSVAG